MKEFPRKFLSLRDKSGEHHRSKSAPPANKARPLSAEAFRAIFKPDHARQTHLNELEAAREASKVEDIQRSLDRLGITDVTVEHIRDILATKFANGDPERTVQFIDIEQKASSGVIIPYDPSVHMVGAENRSAVTCYIDALLFAMFSKLDAFECMLKNDFPLDDPRNKLVTLLRIWVNMLRSGKLIHTDLTKVIQDTMAECGWSDARLLEQQDTSEAFAFLTEKLELPLLSLQVDLYHQGKQDKDDHKIVYERLLNLAVPSDPDGNGVKLEDCLEEYFNTQVDVLRDSEEAKKADADAANPSLSPKLMLPVQIQLVRDGETTATPTALASSPLEMSPANLLAQTLVEQDEDKNQEEEAKVGEQSTGEARAPKAKAASSSNPLRTRSASVIQRVLLDDQGRPTSSDNIARRKRTSMKGSTVVRAVTIPAWQFFRLIPWHAVKSTEPQSNVEVAMNFDQRPVVGICLKRYAMTESGRPQRHNTYIDIPESMRLPHFMLADGPHIEEETNGLATEYKLVLQSVICHRGDSLQSGHYIAFARVAPKLLTGNRKHAIDPPPDYEEAQWVKFDDLEIGNRVTFVEDIKESLKVEMPYLLFYQIVPMVDPPGPSTDSTAGGPPSYDESRTSASTQALATHHEHKASASTQALVTHHEHPPSASTGRLGQSKPPSIRLSAEVERPSRKWLEGISMNFGGPYGETAMSRRPSYALTDSAAQSPAITPDTQSPAMAPVDEPTSSRLSRAASRFNLGKQSRPASQSGEGRISLNLSRFGGLIKTSKEPLPEPPALNISSANSTGQRSPQPGSPTSLEKQLQPSGTEMYDKSDKPEKHEKTDKADKSEKHKHRRKKSKEKNEKQKSGDQPERECVLM
ncbi:cysteine proteinase [Trichoderma longibrachiatum ATCC 18648]|uniref:ubiquitinyl hydrolase 1 n=1 Tax=Trichoderma longibrachiatum ATCC 18648 TaxID=983965 RepID=A0A2T4BYQ1_TRILO|nr:cysteine proteinase [Trichoderma longibrachiatum ATCC 18648]